MFNLSFHFNWQQFKQLQYQQLTADKSAMLLMTLVTIEKCSFLKLTTLLNNFFQAYCN